MSEFHIECVKLGPVEKHANADSLAITNVHGGYPCIVKLGDFKEGDLAVYVPVDSLVPVKRSEFAFLDGGKGREFERVKARRLRGVFSMGLLIHAPAGSKPGDDMREFYGIQKWEPEAEREPTQPACKKRKRSLFARVIHWAKSRLGLLPPEPPKVPVYDIEGIRKHMALLADGEQVVITEKIHGCNSRFVHDGKRLHIGSRTLFRSKGPSVWHTVAERYQLEGILAQYPGAVLFGETYGSVQDLKYGVPVSEGVRFVVFDVLWEDRKNGGRKYFDYDQLVRFCGQHNLPMVPELYRGPWSRDLVKLAEGQSTMPGAKHVREGFVVKPVAERFDHHFGRVIMKLPGEGYLTRKETA